MYTATNINLYQSLIYDIVFPSKILDNYELKNNNNNNNITTHLMALYSG